MEKTSYLAYGSNLNQTQINERCPSATIQGTEELNGYRLLFKRIKTQYYATVEEAKGFYVPTAVYDLTFRDELTLDYQEGYRLKKNGEVNPNPSYTKEYLELLSFKKALIYIMAPTPNYGMPTQTYLTKISEGYKYFGFDKDILVDALTYSVEQQRIQSNSELEMCKKLLK